jgi:hypothetical protein
MPYALRLLVWRYGSSNRCFKRRAVLLETDDDSRVAGLRRGTGFAGHGPIRSRRRWGTGGAFESVRTVRLLMLPRQTGLAGDCTFQGHVGRELRVEHKAKTQGTINAEWNTGQGQ